MKTFSTALLCLAQLTALAALATTAAAQSVGPGPSAPKAATSGWARPDLALGLAVGRSTFDSDEHEGSTVHLTGIADFGRLAFFLEVNKTEHDDYNYSGNRRLDRDLLAGAQWSLFGNHRWDGYVFGAIGIGFTDGGAGSTEGAEQGILRGGLGLSAGLTERLSLTFDVARERRHLSDANAPLLQYVWIETDEWLTRARLGLVLAL